MKKKRTLRPLAKCIPATVSVGHDMSAYAAQVRMADAMKDIEDSDSDTPVDVRPGDAFVFTDKALDSMFGYSGGGGREFFYMGWVAVECGCGLCLSGRFVCSEEGRHFAKAGIRKVNTQQTANSNDCACDDDFLDAEDRAIMFSRRRGLVTGFVGDE